MNGNGSTDKDRHAPRIQETIDSLWGHFVDPSDAWYDYDGTRWEPLGPGDDAGPAVPYRNEAQLREIRDTCRALAASNEFAINGHEYPVTKAVSRC